MPQRGFSLIEALVALLLTTLLMTSVMGIMGESERRNARIVKRLLRMEENAMEERLFHDLLLAARHPLLRRSDRRAKDALGEGDAQSFRFHVSAQQPLACALTKISLQIELQLRSAEDGGELVCASEDGSEYVFLRFKGEASFSYSPDGRRWFSYWPLGTDVLNALQDEMAASNLDGLSLRESISRLQKIELLQTPFVRFNFVSEDMPFTQTWIARAGGLQQRPVPPYVWSVENDRPLDSVEALP